jgi:RNA polymerase sigma-70 factor (ECF subfamily)
LYSAPIYKNIVKIISDRQASEDILQEVFLALYCNKEKIEPSNVASWLFVVSFNKSVSYLKRNRPRDLIYIEDLPEIDNLEADRLDTEEITNWQLQVIREAIDNLSERKRQIFTLIKVENKSIDEVASITGISTKSVTSCLSQSIHDIKSYILRRYPKSAIPLSYILIVASSNYFYQFTIS